VSAVILSELRKIRSTRMWWVLLVCEVILVAFFAAVIGFAVVFSPEAATDVEGEQMLLPDVQRAQLVYTIGVSFGYVFPVILGTLSVTSEVRHRTLATSILLEARRSRIILGKFIAIIPFALLYAVASVLTGLAIGALAFAIAGEPLMLGDAEVLTSLGMGVLALTTWAIVGVGFGTAVTNQVAAVVILLAFTQFVEPILRFAGGFVPSLTSYAAYLPGAAGEAMAGTSFYAVAGASDLLAPWGGFGVLLAYAAITAVIGWLTTFRKDLT